MIKNIDMYSLTFLLSRFLSMNLIFFCINILNLVFLHTNFFYLFSVPVLAGGFSYTDGKVKIKRHENIMKSLKEL